MENSMRLITCAVIILGSLFGLTSDAAAQLTPQRAIVNVTGQLYRAQNDNHYTVFLVTPEGIVMSDPINRGFARWLKAELASRFKVPVRYVLYTHRDWDHASGGVVFADTAEFVGHRNMLAGLAAPAGNPPLPADAMKATGSSSATRPPAPRAIDSRCSITTATTCSAAPSSPAAR
jgi:glyoxylase-like metal-dependent hydrolase (beta-lactamase superfamily II)